MDCEKVCSLPRNEPLFRGSFSRIAKEIGCYAEPPVTGSVECGTCTCCDGKKVIAKIVCVPNKCVLLIIEGESVFPEVLAAGATITTLGLSVIKAIMAGEIPNFMELDVKEVNVDVLKRVIECKIKEKKLEGKMKSR